MTDLQPLGRSLVFIGLLLAAFGVMLTVSPRVPWLGRLPGDILIQRGRFTVYFPLTTCLVISLVVTLVVRLIGRPR